MELAYKKQNIFLYKFMPCLLFFIVSLMCLFGSYVYAYNSLNSSNDSYFYSITGLHFDEFICNDVSLLSTLNQYELSEMIAFYESSYGSYYFIFTNDHYTYNGSSSNLTSGSAMINEASTELVKVFYYPNDLSQNSITHNSSANYPTEYFSNSYSLVYSSYDILDTNGNVVFQAPPQQVEGTQGIIAEKTQGVEMSKTLAEITGILPVILLTIVGILAVRKVIQFLMVLMRKA